ncbi:MAG: DNA primase [Bacteroidales bacterium]|nr:DNA primase [Bacteroidales bacterium]
MIDHYTVERILDAAQIIDVVEEYVSLKKRGVNYLGLCPFHNEKTPSFTVSPAKGIFKCFGCGKGGNSVNFIMEHEHLSYPEALRYLAKKYNIEVQEKELSVEEIQRQTERESMLVVTAYASRKFNEWLFHSDEGISVGLTYFNERGFREDILKKFEVGYSPEKYEALSATATADGYKKEYLVKTGLSVEKDDRIFDRFHGRVIFPIHSLSGQVLGFGGRILKTDAKAAKYLNSPESDIYHKSKILYGIFQARKAIIKEDKCYMVEGYTDVLSVHMAGIENVVASSGTALTQEQVRLVKRFTQNITILYDGDAAGIKASLRGIDLVLEEGMNVRIVLLPDGEDPDSLSKKLSVEEFTRYLADNETDFIRFKAELLLRETGNDPVRRAEAIRDIVRSIAVIPEIITRTVFIKECSSIMGLSEAVLHNEVTKLLRQTQFRDRNRYPDPQDLQIARVPVPRQEITKEATSFYSEKEVVRLLLKYGGEVYCEEEHEGTKSIVTVADFIVREITDDELTFSNKLFGEIFSEFRFHVEQGMFPGDQHFVRHPDPDVSKLAVDLLADSYYLARIWSLRQSYPVSEDRMLKELVPETVLKFKSDKIIEMRARILSEIGEAAAAGDMERVSRLQKQFSNFNKALIEISKNLGGRIVL